MVGRLIKEIWQYTQFIKKSVRWILLDLDIMPINVDQRHNRTPRKCEKMPENKFKWNKLQELWNKFTSDREVISKYPENTET